MAKKPASNQDKNFPIVGIGGSTGADEAVMELAGNLSSGTGMAYIYLQHNGPDNNPKLTSLLAERSKLPVLEAEEDLAIEPDFFYVIPPAKEMQVLDGHFKAAPKTLQDSDYMPVNRFFNALGEQYKEYSIGIILSGTDNDGAFGIKVIKMVGGLTFAQDATARFQSMPRAAIAEGAIDLVLSPKEIAEELISLSGKKEVYFKTIQDLDGSSISDKDEDLKAILQLIQKTVQVDFTQYKMNTVKRRIIRRVLLHKLDSLKEYLHLLRGNNAEVRNLFNDLLINVTTFFRDPGLSEYLKLNLIPEIIRGKKMNEPIRIWVPACATGQEVYSLAMLLVEVLEELFIHLPIQIFATDLSEIAITKARQGIYNKGEIQDVPARRLQRYFTRMDDGNYLIVKSIRDLCVFAVHNIAKDPPFSRLDIISCCNLLIYIDNPLQKKIISTFHYALNPSGYLVLGKSETVGSSEHQFVQLDKKIKIFIKSSDTSARPQLEIPQQPSKEEVPVEQKKRSTPKQIKSDEKDLGKAVDNLLLKHFTPASVIIDHNMNIVQFRGSTGLFLEPTPGKASLNLLKMARPGLAFELRTAVHKAIKTGQAIKKERLEINQNGKIMNITIEVLPVKSELEDSFFLIAFEESHHPAAEELATIKDTRVTQLEAELSSLRDDMRSIVESQEATVEELQSANEEIVSSNEELQSINEELETSKEEVESSNEELITINQELQMRNEQLSESQVYADAVFSTIRESLVILDRNMRVKSANFMFYKTFNLREEHAEGRYFFDLNQKQWDIPGLRDVLTELLPDQNHIYGYEVVHQFPGIGEKTLVINARRLLQRFGEPIMLLAIEDITEHRRAQKMIIDRELWFRNLADNAPVMIWVTDKDKKGTFFNKAWLEFRSDTLEEALEKGWTDGMHPEDLPRMEKKFEKSFLNKLPFESKYRVLHHNNEYIWLHNKARPNFSPEGQFMGFIGSCVVINDVLEEKS
jgi:two-component system CheB/CheR fusion protein